MALDLTEIGPDFVGQHWRAATSSAALSLAKPALENTCGRIVESVESRFSQYSRTDPAKRIMQLKELLWQFVEFKSRLERQGPLYLFWWCVPGIPFRDERMESLTGEHSSDNIVEICLWPSLCKGLPRDDTDTVVVKAVVKVTSPEPCVARDGTGRKDEMESLLSSTEGSS